MEYHNIETLDLRHSMEYRNTSRNVQAVDTKRDARVHRARSKTDGFLGT
jgi:hypothetical protein